LKRSHIQMHSPLSDGFSRFSARLTSARTVSVWYTRPCLINDSAG